jgi:hypothetical protein
MSNNDFSERYLRAAEAARLLGLSATTLAKHRICGTGPTYRKLGGRVVYAPDDLKRWADRGLRHSTSDHLRDVVRAPKPPAGNVLEPRKQPRGRDGASASTSPIIEH